MAEELIWKSRAYNDTFMESYREAFDRLNIKDYHFKRFILGNFDRAEDIHKRPLSKMTQDIARQLGIIR